MKILKEFFDWVHEYESIESIKKWFIDNNIDFPVFIPNIKTKHEFSPIVYYSKNHDEVLNLVNNIPTHYIANVTIYPDIYDGYDGVELGIGVSRIETDDYYTEIIDYLYSLSTKNIKSLYSRYKAKSFNL